MGLRIYNEREGWLILLGGFGGAFMTLLGVVVGEAVLMLPFHPGHGHIPNLVVGGVLSGFTGFLAVGAYRKVVSSWG